MQAKYIFITGGVVSSLGKGLTSAALAMLLERQHLKVAMLKFDPYLNVDPGTMSPYQHGEVYVTDDGAETDLDLGHYYRYTNSPLSKLSNATSGQIYDTVIKRERHGDYLGKTVQVIPHITDEIKQRILNCTRQEPGVDVVLVEIGGTVGDIESLPFFEAIRQFRYERPSQCINVHLTYVPYLKAAGEVKTKPTQQSVQILREIGIMPDLLLCRTETSLSSELLEKISLFCSVPREAVFEEVDVAHSIYEVPLELQAQGVDRKICSLLQLPFEPVELTDWKKIVDTIRQPQGSVEIALVGKYVQHKDAYKSVCEALHHAGLAWGIQVEIVPVESDKLSRGEIEETLSHVDGILVPGGFGDRGWEGKIRTAQYCREYKVPYFGICLGMQVMTVEFARHVLGLKGANSTEMDPETPHPVISLLSEQRHIKALGGTMRLGAYLCQLKSDSKAFEAYGQNTISERHRHRYEVNNHYKQALEVAGLNIAGIWEEGQLCEITEVASHPWMVGVQFHPEFKSKPTAPHPLFYRFIEAAIKHKQRHHG